MMTTEPSSADPSSPPSAAGAQTSGASLEAKRRRTALILTVTAAAFVIVPYLFWRGTWFGRPLNDAELEKFLNDRAQPRHQQHALVQIGERLARGDRSVERWYPRVVELQSSPVLELRVTLAWLLGADNQAETFHQTLLVLLRDPNLLVRRNAALSLVRFSDGAGREEILAMFRPTTVSAPDSGTVRYRAQLSARVDDGTVVARIDRASGETLDVHTPVPGTVREMKFAEGSQVAAGDALMVLSPSESHLWEALRALVVVGQPEDLELLQQFERFGAGDLPERFRQQAQLAAEEIHRRQGTASGG